MIGLVDYGLGNIQAFANIYKQIGLSAFIAQTPEDLVRADRLILPGVGAFDWAMNKLNRSGLRDTLDELVLDKKVDILGVCVGMQMMATRSEEGSEPGLSWIEGVVKNFEDVTTSHRLPLPHMGWNDVYEARTNALFKGLVSPRFYFLHSFYIETEPHIGLAHSTYGTDFICAINSNNVWGTQFHPEKSHDWGVQLLKNFGSIELAAA